MSEAAREMTLAEWVDRLPTTHVARKELDAKDARIAELEARVQKLLDSGHWWMEKATAAEARAGRMADELDFCARYFESYGVTDNRREDASRIRRLIAAIAAKGGQEA